MEGAEILVQEVLKGVLTNGPSSAGLGCLGDGRVGVEFRLGLVEGTSNFLVDAPREIMEAVDPRKKDTGPETPEAREAARHGARSLRGSWHNGLGVFERRFRQPDDSQRHMEAPGRDEARLQRRVLRDEVALDRRYFLVNRGIRNPYGVKMSRSPRVLKPVAVQAHRYRQFFPHRHTRCHEQHPLRLSHQRVLLISFLLVRLHEPHIFGCLLFRNCPGLHTFDMPRGAAVPDLFDDEATTPDLFDDDDDDDEDVAEVREPSFVSDLFEEDEVTALRSRVRELEGLLAASEARCAALEAALRPKDDGIALAKPRQQRETDETFFSAYAPTTRRRQVRGQSNRRLKPLAKQRKAKARSAAPEPSKDDPPSNAPETAPQEEAQEDEAQEEDDDDDEDEDDDEEVGQREDEAVRLWASTKGDVVAMLGSLGEILPPSVVVGRDDLSSSKAVRRAYFHVARRCHPDKSRGLPKHLRYRAQFVFSALTEALDFYDDVAS